jgi:4-aminobutyrate aminotransferase / (S)-3-amino-2-methylpropionate transaminase / 5-aminovalerate transaminase
MTVALTTDRPAALTSDDVLQLRDRYVAPFYQVTPLVVARAEGSRITDVEGKEYIDLASGIAVLNLGHNHPAVTAAAAEQLRRYGHQSYHVAVYEGYVRLAQELDRLFPGDAPTKSFFVNSGAEAVESAIKVARVATGREYVIAFQNAFHGRTELALTATGKTKPSRVSFMRSMAPHVLHAPYPYPYRPLARASSPEELTDLYVGFLERMLDTQVAPENVAAIIVEPIQGEGGVVVPPPAFLRRLRELCNRHAILLIADEVQTGFGRTGTLFGVEHSSVAPDIMPTAKALGAGFPLGAVTARAELMDTLPLAAVGSTFGGHPVACAAALKMIEVLERDQLVARSAEVGEIRGSGAIYGLELVTDRASKQPAPDLVARVTNAAYERGLVTIKAGLYANVVRVLPALTIPDEDLEAGLDILDAAFAAVSTA